MKTLICYATGEERRYTPEEIVRQKYLKILVEDYRYNKEDLILEYPVRRSPSDSRRSVPVDIAVIENGVPKIFVETKAKNVNSGMSQLKSYMDFNSDVKYGVWTNGNEEEDEIGINYVQKIVRDDSIDYIDIFNVPEKGFYSIEEQIKKSSLRPTNNLKEIFKQMRGFIAANATGTTRDESILNELMAILICKIYDERYKSNDDYMDFIVVNNDESITSERIKDIFENKIKVKYPDVFKPSEKINLRDDIVTYVVAQLQKFSITESSHQIVSDAFESIISYASKGSQGQFFTPKNVVDLMVNILNPQQYKYLLDPASGTAGFLTSSMLHVWNKIDESHMEIAAKTEEKKEYAMTRLFGVEKDDFLAKMSKSYMAILGDGKAGLFIEDSLNKSSWSNSALAEIRDDYFDYILTNPPFGKDVKVKDETKEKYVFDSVDLIFVERALSLLKDGGILGIVLPETIFHSPTNKNVREELFYNHNIKCLIDIPHDTFRPYNNAKCDIVFIEKNKPQQEKVLCIKIDNIGHDHNGETVYMYDLESDTFDDDLINDDIPKITELINNADYMSLKKKDFSALSTTEINYLESFSKNRNIEYIDFDKIQESDNLVARNYFTPEIDATDTVTIEQLIEEGVLTYFDGHGSPRGYLKGLGEMPYIRVKDIVNLEVYINPQDLIPEFEYDRLFRIEKELKERDIVFVRRGSYRIGDVGILYKKDIKSILTREILVLRVTEENNSYGITPYNLLYLLNTPDVRKQLKNKVMLDTTLPNIGDRWKKLMVPKYSSERMESISKRMEHLYDTRNDFWKEFENLNE